MLLAAACLMPLAPASGQLVYTSQTRTLYAFAQATGPGQEDREASAAAPDFGPFDATISVNNILTGAGARQRSTLEPSGIVASFVTGAGGNQVWAAHARNILDVSFSIDVSTTVGLGGQFMRGTGNVMASLANAAGTSTYFTLPSASSGTFSSQVALSPGAYRLQVRSQHFNTPQLEFQSTLDLNLLVIPAPGAWSGIGVLACFTAMRRRRGVAVPDAA